MRVHACLIFRTTGDCCDLANHRRLQGLVRVHAHRLQRQAIWPGQHRWREPERRLPIRPTQVNAETIAFAVAVVVGAVADESKESQRQMREGKPSYLRWLAAEAFGVSFLPVSAATDSVFVSFHTHTQNRPCRK